MIKVSHVMMMSELPGIYPISGMENHLLTLLPAIKRAGVDVEFIVLTWNIGPELKAQLAELETQGIAIRIVRCSPTRQWRWLGLRRLEQAARLRPILAARRDRIIHLHLDLSLIGLTLGLARCPHVVLTIHNDDPWMLRPTWRTYLYVLDRMIHHYIAISDRVRRHYLQACRAAPDKITRIYYGLESPASHDSPQAIRRLCQIPDDRFVVGYVGRLALQKNVPLLLAALHKLPDIHGVIVGDGELRGQLENMALKLKIQNVQFLGRRPNAADIMPAFDVLCLPSQFEGLGLVLVEAMYRNVPVIGSRAGAIPEILADGQYGLLFDSANLASLVEAIDFARNNPAALADLTRRAAEYAKRTFSVAAMARQTLNVYQTLAGR